jgi:hypothetical protein
LKLKAFSPQGRKERREYLLALEAIARQVFVFNFLPFLSAGIFGGSAES